MLGNFTKITWLITVLVLTGLVNLASTISNVPEIGVVLSFFSESCLVQRRKIASGNFLDLFKGLADAKLVDYCCFVLILASNDKLPNFNMCSGGHDSIL